MVKGKIWSTLAGAIFSIISFAQPNQIDPELASQLQNKNRLEDIMNTVLGYYKQSKPQLFNQTASNAESQKGNPLNKWLRWAMVQSNRLDDKGHLTDYEARNFQVAMALNQTVGTEVPITQNSNTGSWNFIGPNNTIYGTSPQNFRGLGRVDRITFHPTDANTIYVGTPAGGLWRTTNNGTSWSLLTKYLPSPGISGIVVSTANANIIYILTGDGDSNLGSGLVNLMGYVRRSVGVLRSTDGGNTWQQMGELPGSNAQTVGYKLVQNPTNANILIAATNDGLYHTTNGGFNWTRVRTGRFWDVVFRHNSNVTVYATGDGGDRFIRSTDGGVNWSSTITYSPVSESPSNTGRGQISVGVSATAVVYVLWGGVPSAGNFRGLYKSVDGGGTFTRQSTTPNILGGDDDGGDSRDQSSYDLGIAVQPTNSTQIITAGLTLWGSTNSGTTMVKITSFRESGSFPYIHPDVHDIKYHPSSGWLYAATDGGMYRSNDNGITWTDISPGINTTQYYRASGFEGNSNLVIGGTQDNGVLLKTGISATFRFILCCDGFDAIYRPDDATRGYTSMNTSVFRFNNLNGGASDISPSEGDKWFSNLATHPSNGAILYVGADSFHRSIDAGANYERQSNVSMGWALTSSNSNVNRLYGAGGSSPWAGTGAIRRSDDQGDNWTTINGSTFAPTNLKVTSIGIRPNNSSNVWATIGGFSAANKVFRTFNGSSNPPIWANVTGSLPNVPINCVAVTANNDAYLGTDIGVYYRSSTMSDWIPFFNFLPRVPVTSLILNETAGVIKAVTFGQGIWQSPVYSTCPANTAVGNISGYKLFEAGTSLTANGTIFGGVATEAYLKSGNRIDLLPGFAALAGNEIVKAYIGPCGNGLPTPNNAGGTESIKDDLTTNYPYGAIMKMPVKKDLHSEIIIPEEGTYSLIVTNEAGETIGTAIPPTVLNKGVHRFPMMPQQYPGCFYLELWKDQIRCDRKEW